MPSREQKLVDICFELTLTVLDDSHRRKFARMTIEQRATWVAEQLRGCGFDTTPMGASWGILR